VVRDGIGARLAGGCWTPASRIPWSRRAGRPGGPGESEVTAVVPVRDRPDGLRRLLAALADTAPGLAEVIVVDDGSADPTRTERLPSAGRSVEPGGCG